KNILWRIYPKENGLNRITIWNGPSLFYYRFQAFFKFSMGKQLCNALCMINEIVLIFASLIRFGKHSESKK
ncbi:MAG TPA: hypothetical protein PKN42_10275, partial [Saprospiraceae bacterium]|nr:hypothetical protein [Saprospiraceae bacterium]